jgi:predicted ATP-dependent endonuclease of OLD family
VALTSQVIYVTHSPAMIDAFGLKQIRTVELKANQVGTKINNFVLTEASNLDLLEPVRSAIGMSLVSSLVLNEWNILVEGAADKPIVEGIFHHHYTELRGKLLVNGSLSESKDAFLATFYDRTRLPYVVLLDGDSSGREIASELNRLNIGADKIVKLGEVFPDFTRDFEIEDILSAGFYHQAVLAAYPSQTVEQPEQSDRKRTKLYEDAFRSAFGIGFNKRRVAEAVKKLLCEGKEDEDTRGKLGTLSSALVQKLRVQTTSAVSATRPATG